MYNILFACFLFALGQTLGWFQLNAQFVWDWWKDKPILSATLFSIPTGICFWYGITMSYLTFPVLTWYFLNESMFTAKTMVCVFLSFLIVSVQLFWR